METSRAVIGVVGVVAVGALAVRQIVIGGIEETYSPGWYSESTEHAQSRGVFVASPVVMPSRFDVNDSVGIAVTDAWVERPTHVQYRWFLFRQVVHDSAFRIVVNYAQVVRASDAWTLGRGRSFANTELLINGQPPGMSGNASIHTIYLESTKQPPDTVGLSIDRR